LVRKNGTVRETVGGPYEWLNNWRAEKEGMRG